MQVGSVLVFEAGPLALRSGGIDVARVRAYTAERLAGSALVAGDDCFDAEYAVRHVALPRPGDERQLKRLAARVLSRALERAPFELWLARGRPADLAVADLGRLPEGRTLLGARLRACIPLPALPPGHTLAVAWTRCAGRAVLGFSADAVALRDLALLADAVAGAFELPVQVDSPSADGQPLRSYEAQA